jgi:ABC-2 type transport system permease protein
MWTLFKKEIGGFFSSITGYIVITVFLVSNSLFLWIFPGELNILEGGYATIQPLFIMAPWIFLFLIPAITMKMFAEENRSGTLELLLTRPLSDLQIILSKYLAGIALVILSLLPTLVYLISVYILGDPRGNIDMGGTWGSYIGLLFLASVYCSIGIFASSLADNQIVSFIVAVILSFILYIGFQSLGGLPALKGINEFVVRIGIDEHYRSMSRGVIDTRDLIYFICVNMLFLLFTRIVMQIKRW